MKKTTLLLLVVVTFMACDKENDIIREDASQQASLDMLTSPGGIQIAESIEDLKQTIYPGIAAYVGDHAYDIVGIEYLEGDGVLGAIIHYHVPALSFDSNVIMSNTHPTKQGDNESGCGYLVTCEGGACCTVGGTLSGGVLSFECGCQGCVLDITPKSDCER